MLPFLSSGVDVVDKFFSSRGKGSVSMPILRTAVVCGVVLTCVGLLGPAASHARDTYDSDREYRTRPRVSDVDLRSFAEYLDSHWQVADQLYQNPDLINDRVFVRKNLSLRRWLLRHPEAARAIRADPRAVLWHDRASGDDEDSQSDISDRDLRSWEEFLDSHDAVARELSQSPELLNDTNYARRNSELNDWLYEHREAARVIKANPRKYARRDENPSPGAPAQPAVEEIREFESFLDREWETANALYREPELINDRTFLRDNPSLAVWLRDHPRMARALRERPRDYLWRQRGLSIEDFLRQLLTPRPGN